MPPNFRRRPVAVLVTLVLSGGVASAQGTTPDSTAWARGASPDSTGLPALVPADSLAGALPDSLLGTEAPADSVAAPGGGRYDEAILRPSWVETAPVGPRELAESRPEHLADAVRLLPGVVVRTAGAEGAPAFVGLDAVAAPAPELRYDGVPSRSPADLDPALWDRSAIGLLAVDGRLDARVHWWGDPSLRAELDPPLRGRTLMRTHFTSTDLETYTRGISVTTPQAARVLRFDFEEWKTEDGFLLTGRTNVPGAFGRGKMRRFRAGTEFASHHGRTSLTFGRGRRFHRGNLAGKDGSVERWTGEIAVGWDRRDATAAWRGRAFHLDFHDEDSSTDEVRDATRLGVILQRSPHDTGPGWAATVERWFAAFAGTGERSHPDPAYVGRLAAAWTARPASDWTARAATEVAYAEHTPDKFDVGAHVELSRPSQWGQLAGGGGRSLRTPTLMETDGRWTRDYAEGTRLLHRGGGPLPFERQDRAYVRAEGRWRRLEWGTGLEHARMTRGIGWSAASTVVVGETAEVRTVGELSLDVTQLVGRARLDLGSDRLGLTARVHGHAVLGPAPLATGGHRGAGWPRGGVDGTIMVWRQLASVHNRLGVEGRVRWWGERHDDLLATFVGTDLVPAFTRLDVRLLLKVRDAEMYLAVDNVTDQLLVDVLGTIERPRQLRWGLVWPFFN